MSQNMSSRTLLKQYLQRFERRYLFGMVSGGVKFARSIREQIALGIFRIRISQRAESNTLHTLFLISTMEVGGAQKVWLDLLGGLPDEKYSLYVAAKKNGAWRHKFIDITASVWNLSAYVGPDRFYECIKIILQRAPIRLIVISHLKIAYSWLPELKREFPHIRVVDLIHFDSPNAKHGGILKLAAQYDAYLDRRITINQVLKDFTASRYGTAPQQVSVVHNGVDTDYFAPEKVVPGLFRGKFNLPDAVKIISFVGRLSPEKAPELVLEMALWCIRREYRNLCFIIAGDGREFRSLQEKIEELQLQEVVFLTGHLDDTRPLLKDSDLLFMCSRTESWSLAILEAFAMKLPVVASKVDGVPELVEDGVNGYLIPFDADFIERSAVKLIHLLEHEDERRQMAEVNRRKAVEQYSLQRMVAHYDRVFTQTLSR